MSVMYLNILWRNSSGSSVFSASLLFYMRYEFTKLLWTLLIPRHFPSLPQLSRTAVSSSTWTEGRGRHRNDAPDSSCSRGKGGKSEVYWTLKSEVWCKSFSLNFNFMAIDFSKCSYLRLALFDFFQFRVGNFLYKNDGWNTFEFTYK
jgi:hypothetical protein